MTTFPLEVRYKEHLVWEIDRRPVAGARSRSYYSGIYTPEPGETLPE
jgi:hypothetical protein